MFSLTNESFALLIFLTLFIILFVLINWSYFSRIKENLFAVLYL